MNLSHKGKAHFEKDTDMALQVVPEASAHKFIGFLLLS